MQFLLISKFIGGILLMFSILLLAFPRFALEIAHFYPLRSLELKTLEDYQPKLEGATAFFTERDKIKIPDDVSLEVFLKNLGDRRHQVYLIDLPDGKQELHLTPPDNYR